MTAQCAQSFFAMTKAGLRWVRKADVVPAARIEVDDVEMLLDLWAQWMKCDDPLAAWYPTEASGPFILSWRKDEQDEDNSVAGIRIEKIDACYNSLGRRYQEAISAYYGLGERVWRFAAPATFGDAKAAIMPLFVAKGLL